MRTHVDSNIRVKTQRLTDLKNKTEELERRLSDARTSLEQELAQFSAGSPQAPGQLDETCDCGLEYVDCGHHSDLRPASYDEPDPSLDDDSADSAADSHPPDDRTDIFVTRGRPSAYSRGLPRRRIFGIGAAAVAVLVIVLAATLPGGGASWPATVATLQSETARACQNPDVRSEPGQVNFACAKATRPILWVFALLTSGGNPNFGDAKTGRLGLEPITPGQGGIVAWSLNLHHPYSPSNPIDSLEVAARAINNIIGGATVTSAHGNPVIQPGLESIPANCARYTGSAAVTSRRGFPGLCARPVTSAAGQAALVADVYQKWIVGAAPEAAQSAAVLFENANNPGDPQVQVILRHLPGSKSAA